MFYLFKLVLVFYWILGESNFLYIIQLGSLKLLSFVPVTLKFISGLIKNLPPIDEAEKTKDISSDEEIWFGTNTNLYLAVLICGVAVFFVNFIFKYIDSVYGEDND